jgi:hypothetical protein
LTTRVREALQKLRKQKFAHIFMDPELAADNAITILYEISDDKSLNAQTPLTLMTFNDKFLLPLSIVKRLHALILKPFTLEEFAFRIESAEQKKKSKT